MNTFYHLFIESPRKIVVPRIQRDYVQGSNKAIKISFCKAIVDVLNQCIEEQNRPKMNLNFIYGLSKDGEFIPVDGQQRLTTLWILHLYFAVRAKSSLKPQLSYSVREYSEDFCQQLTDNLYQVIENQEMDIMRQPWFVRSWKKDPTVQAIVSMLNYLHSLVYQKGQAYYEKIWTILCSDDCPITFSLMNPKGEDVNDDLYLKMNSRGRLLSEYENTKSWLDRFVKKENVTWRTRIDNEWTDLVWESRQSNNIDNEQLRLLYNLIIAYWMMRDKDSADAICDVEQVDGIAELMGECLSSKVNKEDALESTILARLNSATNYTIPLYALGKLNIISPSFFDEVAQYYDVLVEHKQEIDNLSVLLFENEKEQTFYNRFLSNHHTYIDSVYTIAILLFFKYNPKDLNLLQEWMRLVRNIVQNIRIDSVDPFVGISKLLLELAPNSSNIYEYLSRVQYEDIESSFAREQMTEEIYKAHLLKQNPNFKDVLWKMEDLSFFKGRLFFAFYCIGIDLKQQQSCTFDSTKWKDVDLSAYFDVFATHFNKDNITSDIRRLLFAAKDHRFFEYWCTWSYSLGMWKFCAIESTGDLSWKFTRYDNKQGTKWMDYLKDVVTVIKENGNDTKRALFTVITDVKNGKKDVDVHWIKELVLNDETMKKYCLKPHMFGIKNWYRDNISAQETECYLFKQKQRPSELSECFQIKTTR